MSPSSDAGHKAEAIRHLMDNQVTVRIDGQLAPLWNLDLAEFVIAAVAGACYL
ncbi:hypothetical protein ACFXIY_18760 [Streptomyces albidoflavus]